MARHHVLLRGVFVGTLFVSGACEAPSPDVATDGNWVGTVTTEGDVTTVINESGSVWGGTARLVEEASIGVEAGDRRYMFGSVLSLSGTDDAIYVLDGQARAIRVFDHDGDWIGGVGRLGQGPGEFLRPESVMVADDGRVFVYESRSRRVNVYSPAGEPLATWSLGGIRASGRAALSPDGRLFLRYTDPGPDRSEHDDDTVGMQALDDEGAAAGPPFTSPLRVAQIANFDGTSINRPFAPAHRSALLPAGAIVGGFSDRYAFEVHWPDGRVTRVERHGDPVPVPPELREYRRQRVLASVRARRPDWTWQGADVPDRKPAFNGFVPDQGGRILVRREGPSRKLEGCEDDPTNPATCWQTERFWDAFTPEGKFLGDVISPVGRVNTLFVLGDLWLIATEDDAATIMVKRYRLVLPADA